MVDGQQFHRCHAEVDQVLQCRLVSQSRVGAAQFFRHAGMGRGEPANVHLVEDGVGERMLRFGHSDVVGGEADTRLRGT